MYTVILLANLYIPYLFRGHTGSYEVIGVILGHTGSYGVMGDRDESDVVKCG